MPTSPSSHDRWAGTLTKRFLSAELKTGRTPKETASQVGCSENTVRDHLVRHGLLDVAGAPKSLARDYERLGSITAVADLHGASFATARRWLLGAGVPLNEAHRPASAELDVGNAARRYKSGQSLAEIATDLGVGVNTLKRRLESHGVTMRPRGPRSS
jgi:DNA-binding CsgD family transcriptional regulator